MRMLKIMNSISYSAISAALIKGILLLAFISMPVSAQQIESRNNQLLKLDNLIQPLMLEQQIQGLAIGIVGNGEPADFRTYGIASVNSNTSVSTETIFEIASTSKPIFASAVMLLVEQWNTRAG